MSANCKIERILLCPFIIFWNSNINKIAICNGTQTSYFPHKKFAGNPFQKNIQRVTVFAKTALLQPYTSGIDITWVLGCFSAKAMTQ